MQPNYGLDDLDARADEALEHCRGYVADLLDRYRQASQSRVSRGVTTVMFGGYGRAGKDTASEYLCKKLGLIYPNSVSKIVAPIVGRMACVPAMEAWNERHERREFWKKACDAIRRNDPTLMLRMCLGAGDMIAGVRGGVELKDALATRVVALAIWVANPRVPVDFTVDYASGDCHLTVENAGTIAEFHAKLDKLAPLIAPVR